MAEAKQGDTVKVNYTGTLANGEVFDSSANREPLQFTLGNHQVIPGFENALMGMEEGASKTVTIASDDAYGAHNEDLVMSVAREQLPEGLDPQVGQILQLQAQNGAPIQMVVSHVDEGNISLDANHPLAGKDLTFAIELVEIVAAA